MVPIARKLCLVLTLVALVGLVGTLPAQATPVLNLGYSVIGAGTTMTNACNAAIALVEDHCASHGTISTHAGRCTDVYDRITGEYLTTICDCTASTGLCLNFIPHPFGG